MCQLFSPGTPIIYDHTNAYAVHTEYSSDFIAVTLLFRASAWLLAITMVELTQTSHGLLQEEEVVCKLLSLSDDDDDQGVIEKLQFNKYIIIIVFIIVLC